MLLLCLFGGEEAKQALIAAAHDIAKGRSGQRRQRRERIGNHIAIEVHIRMNGTMTLNEAHDISRQIEIALKEEFGPETHIGIHMEPNK